MLSEILSEESDEIHNVAFADFELLQKKKLRNWLLCRFWQRSMASLGRTMMSCD